MRESQEAGFDEEPIRVTREELHRLHSRDPYNSENWGDDQHARSAVDIDPIVPMHEGGTGRLRFNFGTGEFSVTTSEPDLDIEQE